MKKLLIGLLLLFLIGCKNNDKSYKNQASFKNINTYLTVKVNVIVNEDDNFDLYFSDTYNVQYYLEDVVRVSIKGSDSVQQVTFRLPEKRYPIKLRLDVGSRDYNTPIEILGVTLTTGDNSKIIKGSDFETIFKPNKHLEKVEGSDLYYRKTVSNSYDPFFISVNIDTMVMDLFKENYEGEL